MGVRPEGIEIDPFEQLIEKKKHKRGVELDNELLAEDLKELVVEFKAEIKKRLKRTFPEDPKEQLWGSISAVFNSWQGERAIRYREIEGIPPQLGHGRQCPIYGVWQYGRRLCNRRGIHARSFYRQEQAVWRIPHQRPRRRCRCRYSHAGARLPAQAQAAQGIQGI